MLDKLILVFYVDVGELPYEEATNYIEAVRESTTLNTKDQSQIIRYIIPTRDGGTRVECLNPPSSCCSNKNDNVLQEKIEIVNDRLDKVDGILFPLTRGVIVEKICRVF